MAEPVPTSTAGRLTTMASPPTSTATLVQDAPPKVVLLPPSELEDLYPGEEQYYSFEQHTGIASYTSRYEIRLGQGPIGTLVEMRAEGTNRHFSLSKGLGESAEVFISETEQWINLSEEGWQRLEQGGEEIDLLNFYASPDSAYAMMYPLFDSLQFDGWVDSGGDRQAIFRGGSTEALEVMQTLSLAWETIEGAEGTIEARWSLDGYFSRITIETRVDGFSMSAQRTVSDVGTTVVDPPLDLPG